jgi:glycosyltransferase involved in cell wall biosynthesis
MSQKIFINGAVLSAKRHGISRYTYQLLRHLDKIDTGSFEFSVFTGKRIDEFEKLSQMEIDVTGTLKRLSWDVEGFPRRAKIKGADAVHAPDKGPLFRKGIPTVATIHDLLPYLYPEERPFLNRKYWQLSIKRQAKLADALITVSHSTKQDLVEMFDISEEKITVTHLGTDFSPPSDNEVEQISQEYKLSDADFNVLYVGNYDERKNVDHLVKACRTLSEAGLDLQLLLAGSDPPISELSRLAGKFRDDVTFLGYVPDENLEGIYGTSDLFVYPSSYEGFGLPVLEAMACGTPVVTSNTSSLPEVIGDAGLTVTPEDTTQLSDAIETVYFNKQLRADMQTRGLQRANKMTWMKTAQSTLSVYQELMQ